MAEYKGPWNFHERAGRKGGVISKWGISTRARARLDRTLDQLRHMPKTNWSKPAPASNIGDHTYVIRFKDESSSQLRVFGHFFDPHLAFVMTFEGFEKDDVYHPENYQDLAQRHRASCEADFPGTTQKFKHYCAVCEPRGDHAKAS